MSEPAPSKANPETLAMRAQPRPVMRLNRRMLAVLIGSVAAVVLGATIWSLQPSKRKSNVSDELFNVDRVAKAENLDQLPKDYAGWAARPASAPVLGPPLPGDLGPAIASSERSAQAGAQQGHSDVANAERIQRLRDAEEAARSAVLFRGNGNATNASRAPASGLPAAGLAPANPFSALGGTTPQPTAAQATDPTAVQNRQDQKEAFVAKVGDTGTRNPGNLQMPTSPYQVMAGTIIPAALLSGIKSDLPGQVIASVTEAVYDTASGRYLLIPQGSRLIGRYDSQVAFGQRRVLLVWTRLIMPDTSSVALDRLPGIDPAGYAGLEDDVDWHWDRILAGAALSTLLGVTAELAAPDTRTINGASGDRVIIAGRESAHDTVNQVGQEITKRNLSIQPTLTIQPGFPMRVMVNKDLILQPYQPLFFQRGTPQ